MTLTLHPAVEARLRALADRYGLEPTTSSRFARLLAFVESDEHAPTAIRDPRTAVDEHIADSLVALDLAEVRAAASIADLGSGAAFPGLPLALSLPATNVFLVESNRRKCDFIRRAIAASDAPNASTVCARAEEWRAGLGRHDVITARALAAPAVVAEYAAPLLRLGGLLIMWRGRREPEAEASAARAAEGLGLEDLGPRAVTPFREATHRHLHLMSKVMETPDRFPRRAGAALKRPLGRVTA